MLNAFPLMCYQIPFTNQKIIFKGVKRVSLLIQLY